LFLAHRFSLLFVPIRFHSWLTFGFVLLFDTSGALAQPVLAPPPAEFQQQNTVLGPIEVATNQIENAETPLAVSQPPSQLGLLNWGQFNLRPHLLYRVSYGNGLQSSPGQKENTVINEVSPGLLLEIGTHWRLDYTPTLQFYSSSQFQNTVNHAVALSGNGSYEDWTFGFSQKYAHTSEPQVQTASQTDQDTYGTSLNAAYALNTEISLTFQVNQNFQFVGGTVQTNQLSDTLSWSTTEGLNYQLLPGLGVGPTIGFGYDHEQFGPDMTHEQFQGRINWQLGHKLSFNFSGGFEDRQFLDSNQSDEINPIFNLSVMYKIFEATTITLSASESISSSYFQGQTTDTTGFTAGLRQRLLGKLYLDVGGGYSTSSYNATTSGITANRNDDHSNIGVRLSCPFLKRGSVSVYYDWSDNSSNESGFSYTSNQVGLELGYRF
jgi:hypothetical protein